MIYREEPGFRQAWPQMFVSGSDLNDTQGSLTLLSGSIVATEGVPLGFVGCAIDKKLTAHQLLPTLGHCLLH